MRKPLKPSLWTRYKEGLCKNCWARCCHGWPVQASVTDLIRLGFLTEEEASLSLSKAATRLKRENRILSFNRRTLIFVLQRKPNGDCIFLDEKRRCSVYKTRPEICRQFPKIGARRGHCPYEPKSQVTKAR